jgi:hypothetical protein
MPGRFFVPANASIPAARAVFLKEAFPFRSWLCHDFALAVNETGLPLSAPMDAA